MAIRGISYSSGLESTVSGSPDIYITADLRQGCSSTPSADAVIDLAALVSVWPSFDHPEEYIEFDSAMVTHMAESFVRIALKTKCLRLVSGPSTSQ